MQDIIWKDYRLSPDRDPEVETAIETEGWYTTPLPRKELRDLVRRSNARAARHFLIWGTLLIVSAALVIWTWGSLTTLPALLLYGVIYNSADSKWHELSHGTPFQTPWINEALYYLVSFMTLREPVRWRWSHARHHTHTIIVGQDPEIASPRPPTPFLSFLGLWYLRGFWGEVEAVLMISLGRIPATVKSYVPEIEWQKMILCSRIFVLVLLATAALCLAMGSLLPAMLFVLPRLYGSFLHYICAFTQHAGLDEDILDFRLNARTVILNPAFAFLYTNMNYHVEHHMFPMVPFYNLPELHKKIRHDCPAPTQGLIRAYKDIITTLARQLRDPSHYQHQNLPTEANPPRHHFRHVFPAALNEVAS